VYYVSERWELDQEHNTKTIDGNIYQPTREDLVIRYVKLLVWKTMDRQSCHAAIGLGCHLYQYRPEQISVLAPELFDKANIRRINAYRLDEISNRFPDLAMVSRPPYGERKVQTRPPSASEHELVLSALATVTPWWTPHLHPTESMLALFSNRHPKREWKRIHALIDPDCAGLARLIRAYNYSIRGNPVPLGDPDDQFEVPKFASSTNARGSNTPDSNSTDRFAPAPLSADAITTMQHALEHNQGRRKLYRPGLLRVYADGKEQVRFNPGLTSCEPFTIPGGTRYLEIFGEDDEGALLLAVFPLPERESTADNGGELVVVHEGGQTMALNILPRRGGNGKATEFRMQIVYSESRQTPVSGLEKLPYLRAVTGAPDLSWVKSWRFRPVVPGLVVAALCSLTLWLVLPVRQEHPPVKNTEEERRTEGLLSDSSQGMPRSYHDDSDVVFFGNAPLDALRGGRFPDRQFPESSETHWLYDVLQDTLHEYYLTVQREVVSQIVGARPAELIRTLRNAVEALWAEVNAIDTPEALIDYFRAVGLASIAEHSEVTQAKSIPQRPPAWDSRLEAAAIKQGLVEALSKVAAEDIK
jgi:hypothetical protein